MVEKFEDRFLDASPIFSKKAKGLYKMPYHISEQQVGYDAQEVKNARWHLRKFSILDLDICSVERYTSALQACYRVVVCPAAGLSGARRAALLCICSARHFKSDAMRCNAVLCCARPDSAKRFAMQCSAPFFSLTIKDLPSSFLLLFRPISKSSLLISCIMSAPIKKYYGVSPAWQEVYDKNLAYSDKMGQLSEDANQLRQAKQLLARYITRDIGLAIDRDIEGLMTKWRAVESTKRDFSSQLSAARSKLIASESQEERNCHVAAQMFSNAISRHRSSRPTTDELKHMRDILLAWSNHGMNLRFRESYAQSRSIEHACSELNKLLGEWKLSLEHGLVLERTVPKVFENW